MIKKTELSPTEREKLINGGWKSSDEEIDLLLLAIDVENQVKEFLRNGEEDKARELEGIMGAIRWYEGIGNSKLCKERWEKYKKIFITDIKKMLNYEVKA